MTPRTPRGGIEAVSAAILAMNRRLDVREVLQTIVASARELLGAQYAALGVPDDHGGFAQFVVDGVSDEQWRAIGPLPRQHGVLAAMLHEATPQRLADVREFESFAGWPRAHPVMTDFIGMPVLDGEEILGAVFLANKICPPGAEEPRPDGSPGSDGTAGGDGGSGTDGADGGGKGPRKSRCGFTQEDEDLLRLLADHAAIALTNARLHERSRELTLAGERARIAHELHDAVSQKLFSLRLTAQASAALVDADPGRAKQEIRQVAALAAEAADELRAVVVELRPAALDEDGLVATLRTQVEVLDRVHSANVTFRSFAVRALPAAQEEALLRVAQEAVHNALRHSGARNVGVALEGRGKGVRLRVRDDGRGFDPGAVRRSGRHLGLVSMRDRAGGVGGRLDVHSAPGKGTVIEMEVPGG
ncbi:GAF domain-containing sensor histidine kinase [Actinacidiphila guanduensis]|uniref:Oxygen sensor histidine kinase NreB n=1 Tax=Actinacidiphila guanduensis TaxID=310781 RepID=A0A1H0E8I8_9ACTN|nr:GAF domain-containing sensor histidine kinase [Actinacidiphila guanduensis]SDN78639.1 Histidine kinase-, DNA gyrase B-, and HSP90-like ATPase [Actinacidiphila guanduensis]